MNELDLESSHCCAMPSQDAVERRTHRRNDRKTAYWEKLRDPRWQRKRLEVMERDGFACQRCGRTDKTLNVHHHAYINGINPWDYEQDFLVTLCEECHSAVEDFNIKRFLSRLLVVEQDKDAVEVAISAMIVVADDGPPKSSSYDDVLRESCRLLGAARDLLVMELGERQAQKKT